MIALAQYSETDVRALWRAYKKLGSVEARRRLIEFYLPLADYVASRICRRMPPQITFDEIFSDATVGLLDAIERYDPYRGVKFQSFAQRRIAGQVIDEMRRRDWVPRTVLTRTKIIKTGMEEFNKANGRAPSTDELRRFLKIPVREFDKILKYAADISVSSLSNLVDSTDPDGARHSDTLIDRESVSPAELAKERDLKTRITRSLNRVERLLIILYFWEGLTMREAGTAVGLSESRVSQMLSSILSRLRISIPLSELE